MSSVTRAKAERTLRAVRAFISPYGVGATLYSADHEDQPRGCWSIALEGGPENWPHLFSEAVGRGEVTVPANVFVEPMSSWSLGIYPDGAS